jgi:flavin-dependent dehydrogenase
VPRADFDLKMMQNAREKGAEVIEEIEVKALIEKDSAVVGVLAKNKEGQEQEYRAPVVVDASGRDAFSINKYRSRIKDDRLKKVSIWTYYKSAKRDPGEDEGATTIAYLPEKAWFWYIPLPNDEVSVGVVGDPAYLYSEGKDSKEIFEREILKNEWIRDHLTPGKVCNKYFVTSDFSYRSEFIARQGLVLVGDAYAFLDPVFSSGIFLALKSGEMAADAIEVALQKGDASAGQFEAYREDFNSGLAAMKQLVYAFYDPGFSFGKLMRKYPELRSDLTDCLIGNLKVDFTALFKAVSEFSEMAERK